jgi:hypothetical protein
MVADFNMNLSLILTRRMVWPERMIAGGQPVNDSDVHTQGLATLSGLGS